MSEFVSDPFWKEEVCRARQQTPARKFLLGGELFDSACEVALSGIRSQNPGIGSTQAVSILRKRLELARKIEGRV